ncbi:hypothetical protein [Brevibacillus porteri]|uniref:hypothetical protein n=1 Tax=Brevibacillus porteri TaxID=2126350 RepID=UPI003D2523C6
MRWRSSSGTRRTASAGSMFSEGLRAGRSRGYPREIGVARPVPSVSDRYSNFTCKPESPRHAYV